MRLKDRSRITIGPKYAPRPQTGEAGLGMLPMPTRATLPDGRSSRTTWPADAGTIGKNGLYNLPFPVSVFDELLKHEGDTPDVSHAIHLWMEFANTGHKPELTGPKSQVAKAYDILNDLAERIGSNTPGADGLMNGYLRQLGLYGCISSEDVIRKDFRGIDRVELVSPRYVRLAPDGAWQVDARNGEALLLSPLTYAYYAYITFRDSPYAAPPIISALSDLARQEESKENLKFIIQKLGLFGLAHATMKKPLLRDGETPQDYMNRLASYGEEYAKKLVENLRNGIVTTYDDIEIQSVGTSGTGDSGPKIFELQEQQIFTGLGLDPAMAGRSYSTTETYAGVVYRLLCRRSEAFQRLCKRRLERTYRLELALQGIHNVDVSVDFNPLPSLTPDKDAEREQIKVTTVLAKIQAGIIDKDEAARELGYEKATGESSGSGNLRGAGDGRPFGSDLRLDGYDAVMSEGGQETERQLQKAISDALKQSSGITDKAIEKLLTQVEKKATEIDDAGKFADWVIRFMQVEMGKVGVVLAKEQLASMYLSAWMDAVTKETIGITPWMPRPDRRTLQVLEKADGFFLTKYMYNEHYGAKARKWVEDKFFRNNGLFFKRMTQETIQEFREQFKDLLQQASDTAIQMILDTAIQRARNWGIIENLHRGGIAWAQIKGPVDRATCATCMALVDKKLKVSVLYARYLEEREALGAAKLDRDTITEYFKKRNEDVRQAVKAGVEGSEDYDILSVMPPLHPRCRHRLFAWRDKGGKVVAPPTVKTYAEGEKYIKQAIKDGIITKQDQEYIRRYTDEDYKNINSKLRNGKKLTKAEAEVVDGVTALYYKLPKFDGVVYRGEAFKEEVVFKRVLQKRAVSDFAIDQIFSTSVDKSTANDFKSGRSFSISYTIICKKGAIINGLSKYGEENEVLFLFNHRFAVKSVDNSKKNHILINMKDMGEKRG